MLNILAGQPGQYVCSLIVSLAPRQNSRLARVSSLEPWEEHNYYITKHVKWSSCGMPRCMCDHRGLRMLVHRRTAEREPGYSISGHPCDLCPTCRQASGLVECNFCHLRSPQIADFVSPLRPVSIHITYHCCMRSTRPASKEQHNKVDR